MNGQSRKHSKLDNLERFHAHDRHELRAWLEKNHHVSQGMLLLTYRRSTGKPRPEIGEIVEELLCFGWIDSKLVKLDEERTMLLCTPRRPRSHWSKSNKERVERLTRVGLMQPRGFEAVALAKRNGSWDSLNDVEQMVEPQDLCDALDAVPEARRHWEAYPASHRRQVLYWLRSAKRPQTRRTRVERAVAAAGKGLRLDGSTRVSADSAAMRRGEG